MPVSYFPLWMALFLILLPWLKFRKPPKTVPTRIKLSICFYLVIPALVYVYGLGCYVAIADKNPATMYRYSKWAESCNEWINKIVIWPFVDDDLAGYSWLERAAELNYPPALYCLGWRLKTGRCVPKPEGWKGPSGNAFPQPEKGQPLIDRALQAGFVPSDQD